MSGALYSRRQHPLMKGAVPRNSPRDNLPAFVHESFQETIVKIIDGFNLLFTEAAYPPSSTIKFRHIYLFSLNYIFFKIIAPRLGTIQLHSHENNITQEISFETSVSHRF